VVVRVVPKTRRRPDPRGPGRRRRGRVGHRAAILTACSAYSRAAARSSGFSML
jgi:hypothetical protein